MDGFINGQEYTDEFSDIIVSEFKIINARRSSGKAGKIIQSSDNLAKEGSVPEDLFGVALSGGGIRSASFCLGALQALDQDGLIERMDYLSTVSGGGYVGSGMIAGMTRDNQKFPYTADAANAGDVRDSAAVAHIRDHSRFLAPHGLRDIILSIAIILRGLAVNLCLILSVVLPAATLLVLTNPTEGDLNSSIIYHIAGHFLSGTWVETLVGPTWWARVGAVIKDPFILSKVLAVVLPIWLILWACWRSYEESYKKDEASKLFEPGSWGASVGRALVLAVVGALTLEVQPIVIRWAMTAFEKGSDGDPAIFSKFSLTAIAGAAAAAATFRQLFSSWIQAALNSPTIGARFRSMIAKTAFYAAGLAVPLLIYALFLYIAAAGVRSDCVDYDGLSKFLNDVGWPVWLGVLAPDPCNSYPLIPTSLRDLNGWVWLALAALCLVAISVRLILARVYGSTTALLDFFRMARSQGIAAKFVAISAFVLATLVTAAIATRSGAEPSQLWRVLAGYIVLWSVVGLIGWTFTENANGLHRLYRDRIGAAFLTVDEQGNALPLSKISESGPYILVNAALNVTRSATPKTAEAVLSAQTSETRSMGASGKTAKDPALRGRNAEFFLFSRNYIGSDLTGYARSDRVEEKLPQMDLATAAAISGAAVSSSMGRFGLGILGPTLALLNLRLGYWLSNPRQFSAKPASTGWYDALRLYLFNEILGRLTTDSSQIYITDGGHIDNIGLYQLLKRRCKLIIVVDAEADSAMNFGAFCDVQRFVRIDEGTRITLDWRQVREASLKRQENLNAPQKPKDPSHDLHFAVGKITYESTAKGSDKENASEEGLLLYVKASVTGDESDYILDYERRYPAFPHESTGDLFFSEEQMEAYRALGFHAMRRAIRPKEPEIPAYSTTRSLNQLEPVHRLVERLYRSGKIDRATRDGIVRDEDEE